MRRVLLTSFFAAAIVGFGFVGTAGADISPTVSINPIDISGVPIYSNVILSFDFSDNSAPPSASAGQFNIVADVFPGNTGGDIRMVAIAPSGSGESNLVCPFSAIQQAQVECSFNFTTPGVWSIRAQYAEDMKQGVSSVSITNLRVGN